ncbi:MAG: hypothetical protein K6G10_01410 [Butyrivibrio sp.]|nr:hypothetical protein [Butyrivibrio sp.]
MGRVITKETNLRVVRENGLMPARVCNGLMRGGCNTVGDMLDRYNDYTLSEIRDMGGWSILAIERFLKDNGFLDECDGANSSDADLCGLACVSEYSVQSNEMFARILVSDNADSEFLDLVKLTLTQALEDKKEKIKFKEFESNPLTTKLEDVRPKLSIRSFNCLYRHGCKTVGDVLKLSRDDLLNVRNLGRRGIEEVVEAFSKYGKFNGDK